MNKQSTSGFTLIELMIIIAVIAILAAIAWPSYQNFIRKTRLEAARADLMANAQMLERFYSANRTFCPTQTVPSCLGFPAANTLIQEKSNNAFNLGYAAGSPTPDTYVLLASPITSSGETRFLRYDSTTGMMLCQPNGRNTQTCKSY